MRAGPTDPKAPEKGSGAELIAVLQNTEVLAVSDDPLGMEAVRLEDAGGHSSPDVFLGQMAGGKFAAVLFNRNGAANMTLKLSDTKVVNPAAAASHYRVRDLWSHTENGTVAADGELTAMVGWARPLADGWARWVAFSRRWYVSQAAGRGHGHPHAGLRHRTHA